MKERFKNIWLNKPRTKKLNNSVTGKKSNPGRPKTSEDQYWYYFIILDYTSFRAFRSKHSKSKAYWYILVYDVYVICT
jgi:hypothetical protein